MEAPSRFGLRARSPREHSPAGLLTFVALLAGVFVTTRFGALGDYTADAGPSVTALSRWRLKEAFAEPALMGPLSIILRAPFVALARVAGAGLPGQYELGAFVCVAAAGLLGVGLSIVASRRATVLLVLVVLAAIVNPATVDAVRSGHPEEALGAGLAVAAVVLASRGRLGWAALTLGLALATKQWAILAVPPTLLVSPPGRRLRLAVEAGGVAILLMAPLVVGNADGFVQTFRTATAPGGLTTPGSWLFFLSSRAEIHVALPHGYPSTVTVYRLPLWIANNARLLMVAAALPLSLLAARRHNLKPAVFPLLAVLFLLRAVLDPIDNAYYNLPLLLALLAWETLTRKQAVPVVTLLTCVGLWVTFDVMELHDRAPATALTYLGWTALLFAYLLRNLWRPTPQVSNEPARKPGVGLHATRTLLAGARTPRGGG